MTRQVRSWAIAALAFFALAGAAAPSFAGIVYNVTNYELGQNGWSLAGTITVSGTGTLTSDSDITDYDITVQKGSTIYQYSKSTSNAAFPVAFSGTLNATPTTLSLAVSSYAQFSQSGGVPELFEWYNAYDLFGTIVTRYAASWGMSNDLWDSNSNPAFSPIVNSAWTLGTRSAPVPEIDPATGSSALSLVAGVLATIEQRRRRATIVA
jgi:hypothetical protein